MNFVAYLNHQQEFRHTYLTKQFTTRRQTKSLYFSAYLLSTKPWGKAMTATFSDVTDPLTDLALVLILSETITWGAPHFWFQKTTDVRKAILFIKLHSQKKTAWMKLLKLHNNNVYIQLWRVIHRFKAMGWVERNLEDPASPHLRSTVAANY